MLTEGLDMTPESKNAKGATNLETRPNHRSSKPRDLKESERKDLLQELVFLRNRVRQLEQAAGEGQRAKVALQDQLQLLQSLMDTIPNPIFYKNTSGVYLGCNKAFEKRLGLPRERIVGRTSRQLFPEKLAEKYARMDATILESTEEHSHEDTILYADGTEHIICLNKGTFTTAEGRVAGIVGVTVDITDRRRAEEALKKTLDELEFRVADRTRELARTNEELRREMAEKEKAKEAERASVEQFKVFAHSVVHDLKSPSVGISGLANLLKRQYSDKLDGKGRQYCDQIFNASQNVVTLVEQINAYLTAREVPMQKEWIDGGELLGIVAEEFQESLQKREIGWSAPRQLPMIKGDKLALLRVFRNLVENALKYGGEQLSRVTIGYEKEGPRHVFSVQDNGEGIPAHKVEKIFGIFQRGTVSKNISGSGLGLAIVKEIARQHQGEAWVQGHEGGGTTFFFSLHEDL